MERATYHHGDLAAALVEAAVEAGRTSGESGITLKGVAAAVGVSSSAAYRHYPGGLADLLAAVGDVARRGLAERITARMSAVTSSRSRETAARRRFRASGEAYVEYVLDEPGLFDIACRHGRSAGVGSDPFGLLAGCIDDLVAAGALPAQRSRDAAFAAWAAVHGLAVLLSEGSLRHLSPARRTALVQRTLDMVERGL